MVSPDVFLPLLALDPALCCCFLRRRARLLHRARQRRVQWQVLRGRFPDPKARRRRRELCLHA
ncbi:hypothetical protein, partial [Aeromicrobium phragmitis]|uniref:hypothetical protein n=1 Tax=Aeromicrobium phragmitis TaxID=2478914 RepID=UPI001AA012AB